MYSSCQPDAPVPRIVKKLTNVMHHVKTVQSVSEDVLHITAMLRDLFVHVSVPSMYILLNKFPIIYINP